MNARSANRWTTAWTGVFMRSNVLRNMMIRLKHWTNLGTSIVIVVFFLQWNDAAGITGGSGNLYGSVRENVFVLPGEQVYRRDT